MSATLSLGEVVVYSLMVLAVLTNLAVSLKYDLRRKFPNLKNGWLILKEGKPLESISNDKVPGYALQVLCVTLFAILLFFDDAVANFIDHF